MAPIIRTLFQSPSVSVINIIVDVSLKDCITES